MFYATRCQTELPTIPHPAGWSRIFDECLDARPHSSAVLHLETSGCCLQSVMHFYNRSAKMSCIHIIKELSRYFSLFNCSFKLSGSLDIFILPCGKLNFYWILALQNLMFFILFLSGKSALLSVPH